LGLGYVLKFEPLAFRFAEQLATNYDYGYWHFFSLSNGGFYMAPRSNTTFNVVCDNGYEGKLSADALGIVACLYAYSYLSFGEGDFAAKCGEHYHRLREYVFGHPEVKAILRAVD
jgi:hypothetical protein